ncbi:response regulator transcription factor [Novosphingobium resinovorum]|uniref:DNA-binding response regulator n=1 Tax=Novosphingobium resinovorum TaxID=158500 RepID=A0A031J5G2_9SPHN|nr:MULTISPECIES: response regulator transcription factor [Sphingomonadaceae]AOR79380.1 DNA-binding response regulator [Novosphingobium resinovorum]EJU11115.1 winged helix family two component transcriptional regulator [Sphingomonas sp. LH128]EZP68522.1 Winged helix family two component transcriptional regulator [Novosphingobium resinovorum]MBF7013924.1 response regulator transcription factor [Novosphingobium sp. HR1a]WJM26067.1 response regulator transcription factor [Novosphingobium resinovor
MRLLLVEDDADLRETIARALELAGHRTDAVAAGEAADLALHGGGYDLVVLDLGLPDLDGLDLLRRVRGRRDATPILILTARDAIDDRIAGLRAGADDYLVKPFALGELEARIEAIRRRLSGTVVRLVNGPLEFDPETRRAFVEGQPIDLSLRETDMLEALIGRVGEVVQKAKLAQQMSNWDREVATNSIEVYVSRLRRKLAANAVRIRTIHGLGYLMEHHRNG